MFYKASTPLYNGMRVFFFDCTDCTALRSSSYIVQRPSATPANSPSGRQLPSLTRPVGALFARENVDAIAHVETNLPEFFKRRCLISQSFNVSQVVNSCGFLAPSFASPGFNTRHLLFGVAAQISRAPCNSAQSWTNSGVSMKVTVCCVAKR